MPALTRFSLSLIFLFSLMLGTGYFIPSFFYAGLGGISLLGLGGILDFFISPSPGNLQITRKITPRLSLGDENPVALSVSNTGTKTIRGTLADNVPSAFQKRDTLFPLHLRKGESEQFKYVISPHRRGAFQFEAVTLSIQGSLGLIKKVKEIPLPDTFKVYPSYLKLKKYQLQARRSNVEQTGKRKIRRYGEGREFESLREYTPDDEYRKVNWKATARRGKPIVSQFQIERNQNIIIVLDAGRMMRSRPDDMTKLDHAVNAALMLSYICVNKEDNAGLLIFDKSVRSFIPPRRGRGQLNLINEILYNTRIEFCEPDYREAFHFLRKKVSRRSLVILLTDIIDERASETLIKEFMALYPQHLPLCITVRDESLEQIALSIPSDEEGLREMGIAQQLLEERIKGLSYLRKNGVLVLDTDSKNLSVEAINKYTEIKGRGLI